MPEGNTDFTVEKPRWAKGDTSAIQSNLKVRLTGIPARASEDKARLRFLCGGPSSSPCGHSGVVWTGVAGRGGSEAERASHEEWGAPAPGGTGMFAFLARYRGVLAGRFPLGRPLVLSSREAVCLQACADRTLTSHFIHGVESDMIFHLRGNEKAA